MQEILELELCHIYAGSTEDLAERLRALAKEVEKVESWRFEDDSGSIYLSDGTLLEYTHNELDDEEE